MVVGQPAAAKLNWSVQGVLDDYTINGEQFAYPVSGDLTAQTPAHDCMRSGDRTLNREGYCWPDPVLVAAGTLHKASAVQLVEVQCTDCPWGLKVYGWDSGADTLAQRHADARQHAVLQAVVR